GFGALAKAFLEHVAAVAPPYGDTTYFLGCFSAVDNSLSQWRAYGGHQAFGLTFPGDVTHRRGAEAVAAAQGQTAGITLLEVIYDRKVHDLYIGALLDALVALCDSPHMSTYPNHEEAISHIAPFYWGQLER